MSYKYNDGGREEAGFKSRTDCGIRAVAIACQMTYCEAREVLKEASANGRRGSRAIARGIFREDMDAALNKLGWSWRQAPRFEGRKAKFSDMPKDKRVIVRMAKHYAAVCYGELNDTWDSSHKMVYGYWAK